MDERQNLSNIPLSVGRPLLHGKGAGMRDYAEMEMMLGGYGLTTAEILYRMPDHPHVLQSYLWQDYDLAPKFPALMGFVTFWKEKLEGPLHSVRYTHRKLISPSEWRNVQGEIVLQ